MQAAQRLLGIGARTNNMNWIDDALERGADATAVTFTTGGQLQPNNTAAVTAAMVAAGHGSTLALRRILAVPGRHRSRIEKAHGEGQKQGAVHHHAD